MSLITIAIRTAGIVTMVGASFGIMALMDWLEARAARRRHPVRSNVYAHPTAVRRVDDRRPYDYEADGL